MARKDVTFTTCLTNTLFTVTPVIKEVGIKLKQRPWLSHQWCEQGSPVVPSGLMNLFMKISPSTYIYFCNYTIGTLCDTPLALSSVWQGDSANVSVGTIMSPSLKLNVFLLCFSFFYLRGGENLLLLALAASVLHQELTISTLIFFFFFWNSPLSWMCI